MSGAGDAGPNGKSAAGARRRPWRSLLVGLAVSGVFVWLTLRRVDLSGVWEAMSTVSLPVLSLALLTRGAAFLALGLRSKATLAPGGSMPYPTLTLSHLLGYTGNNVLPFRLGELLRIDYLARRGTLSRSFLVGTVAVERLMDTMLVLALFAVSVPTVVDRALWEGSFPVLMAATAGALTAALVAIRWRSLPRVLGGLVRPLSPRLAELTETFTERVRSGLSALADARWAPAALGATALYWLCSVGSVTVVLAAFGLELPWYAPVVVLAVTVFGTALPSSPAFVGTYHYFSALGVSLLGVDATTSTSYAIVAHAMAVVPYTLLGLVVFARSIRVWVGEDADGEEPAT